MSITVRSTASLPHAAGSKGKEAFPKLDRMKTKTSIFTAFGAENVPCTRKSSLPSPLIITTIPPVVGQLSRRCALLSTVAATLPLLSAPPPAQASTVELEDALNPAEGIFKLCAPSVVALGTFTSKRGLPTAFTAIASGIIWSNLGYIVTAYSPVNAALRKQSTQALVVAVQSPTTGSISYLPITAIASREPSLDLIVIQVDFSSLSSGDGGDGGDSIIPITLSGRSPAPKVGEDVFLIGSTAEGGRTIGQGVLSATGRSIPAPNGQAIRGALQTDVDITKLGLGGALLDSSGGLIGIPTVSYAKPGAERSSGVNFAISRDTLLDAVPKMIAYGNVAGRR